VKETNAIHQGGIDAYGNPGTALFSIENTTVGAAGTVKVAFKDALRVAAAAQFRVIEAANNTGDVDASIAYVQPQTNGPTTLTKVLANNPSDASAVAVRATVGVPFTGVTTIPNGFQNINLLMGEPDPGQQLQVFTRDGRQLVGAAIDSDMQSLMLKPENGFATNATYSNAYLNVTGTESYKDLSVFYGAKAEVGKQLRWDMAEADPAKHTALASAPAADYAVADSAAAATSLVINPTLTGQVQYDPHKSFELVSLMSFTPFILHVNAAFPAKSMAELVAHVKANPGKFNIASSGIGATNHLIAEMFKQQAGLDITHVPYKGGAQAGQDVAGGQAQMMFSAALEARPLLMAGKTRAIAITSAQRTPAFADIPTVAESAGIKDFAVVFWQGMVVPSGTPRAIIEKLEKAIAKVAADPDMIERFKPQGVEIRASSQAEFRDFMDKEEVRWVRLIKERNIKPE
jgi:tripartite-type tricarboxylate transporter receptor subunit TctC